MSKRRVVITGLGIVSPVGNDVADRVGVDRRPAAAASVRSPVSTRANFPTHFGGEIRELDLAALHERQGCAAHGRLHAVRRRGRHAGDARLRTRRSTEANSRPHRRARWAPGMGGLESIEQTYDKYLETHSPKKVSPFFIPASIINLVSGHLSIAFKITGSESRRRHGLHHLHARHRHGDALDPVRRCGCDARGRFGDGDLPHRHERLRAGESAVTAQRRSAGGQPPLGQGSRRIRDGRRRRRHDARGVRARQGARRQDLRRGRRLRHERRCLPRDRTARGRRGRAQVHGQRAHRCAASTRDQVQYVNAHATSTELGDRARDPRDPSRLRRRRRSSSRSARPNP